MNRRLIAYTAATSTGIAAITTDRNRPSWAECRQQIPGFITGTDLGPAAEFALRYTGPSGTVTRMLDAAGVERVGTVVMRVKNISDIAVLDEAGGDVTFDFACFRG